MKTRTRTERNYCSSQWLTVFGAGRNKAATDPIIIRTHIGLTNRVGAIVSHRVCGSPGCGETCSRKKKKKPKHVGVKEGPGTKDSTLPRNWYVRCTNAPLSNFYRRSWRTGADDRLSRQLCRTKIDC